VSPKRYIDYNSDDERLCIEHGTISPRRASMSPARYLRYRLCERDRSRRQSRNTMRSW